MTAHDAYVHACPYNYSEGRKQKDSKCYYMK